MEPQYAAQDAERRPTREISVAVVEAVAERRGVDPLELPAIWESIDPDALDKLFETDTAGPFSVSFEAAGCRVTVHDDGRISTRRLEDSGDPRETRETDD